MKLSIGIILILFAIGVAFAIQPVGNWTLGPSTRYSPTAPGSNITTSGGNVTSMNISSNISTTKWAGYWGNISGQLLLSPGSGQNNFYSWTWNSSNGGVVCAVAAPYGFNWASVASVAASAVDTAWSFGAASDNATNTLTTSSCAMTVGGIAITGTAGNKTGAGGFTTCAVDDGATTTKGDFAFCVNISSAGSLFNGQKGNYELMVPTNKTYGATETYSFWMDLG